MANLRFYDSMDSVKFNLDVVDPEVRRQNEVIASGIVMLDMLTSVKSAVLSENQAYDGFLPDLIGLESTDSAAVCRLVRQGRIRVHLFEPSEAADVVRAIPAQRGRDGQWTLLQAFAQRLTDPSYILSAWPELADPERRAQLLADVTEGRPTSDVQLAERVNGLRNLSEALDQQGRAVLVRLDRTGGVMYHWAMAGIDALKIDDPQLSVPVAQLRARIESLAPEYKNTRTAWYRTFETFKHEGPNAEEAVRYVRDIADYAYNTMVVGALGVRDTYRECATDAAADAVERVHRTRGDPERATGERVLDLLNAKDGQQWLTWEKTADLLPDLMRLENDGKRVIQLVKNYGDFVVPIEQETSRGLKIMVAVPATLVAVGAGAVGAMVEGSRVFAGLITAAVSTLGLFLPRAAEGIRNLDARRRRARITAGAASWFERRDG